MDHLQAPQIVKRFLARLNWQPLDDEGEFRFLTALYAKYGQNDDISAYHAIRHWMDDVGRELNDEFHVAYVADRIDANLIYASYYSYSNVTGGDLIPSIKNPANHDWKAEREMRPKHVFADWLANNPMDYEKYMPLDTRLLTGLGI